MTKAQIYKARLPVAVYRMAHKQWPNVVAEHGLYGAAFFGHSYTGKITLEGLWRGLLRDCMAHYSR